MSDHDTEEMKPDRDINLSEEEVAFYYEVGRSLSQWAHVENHLRKIAGLCVSHIDALTVQAGFLAIESFRSKRQFVDALIKRKHRGNAELVDRWAKLDKRCAASAETRNKIAHRKPILFPDAEPTRRVALVEWDRPKTAKGSVSPPPGSICLANVIEARLHFLALTTALSNFRSVLDGAEREPFPKALEQSTDPPTIRETRNYIRGALGAPRLPSLKTPKKRTDS